MPRRNFDASMIARLREDQAQAAYLRRQRLVTGPPVSSGTNNILLNPQTTNYNSSSQTQAQNGMETTFINGSLRNVYTVGCACDLNEVLSEPTPPVPPIPPIPPTPPPSAGSVWWATSQIAYASYVLAMNVDPSGYIYQLIGYIGTGADSLALNNYVSDSTTPITVSPYGTIANSNLTDTCLVKYDPSGQVQWATTITGANVDLGSSIGFDSAGNVIIAATIASSTVTINSFVSGGGGGPIVLSSYGTFTAFPGVVSYILLVKYTANGTVQWATQINSATQLITPYLAIDSADNIYITGESPNSAASYIDFYNQNGVLAGVLQIALYGRLSTVALETIFLAKYNSNGIVQWVTDFRASSSGGFGVNNICISPDGSINICGGSESNSIILNRWASTVGTTITTLLAAFIPAPGAPFSFFVKYNPFGDIILGSRIVNATGPFSLQDPMGLITDTANNLYITGAFSGNLLIYNFISISGSILNTIIYGTLTNGGGTAKNTYVIKYDSGGTVQWATRIWNASVAGPGSATVDLSGNLYVSGTYDSAVTIDNFVSGGGGGAITTTPYASMATQAGSDTYSIIKYSPTGSAIWATNGTAPGPTTTDLTYIKCDGNNAIYYSSSYASMPAINNYVSTTAGIVNTTFYNNLSMLGAYYNAMLVKYAI
jgi:hypothetical protein